MNAHHSLGNFEGCEPHVYSLRREEFFFMYIRGWWHPSSAAMRRALPAAPRLRPLTSHIHRATAAATQGDAPSLFRTEDRRAVATGSTAPGCGVPQRTRSSVSLNAGTGVAWRAQSVASKSHAGQRGMADLLR